MKAFITGPVQSTAEDLSKLTPAQLRLSDRLMKLTVDGYQVLLVEVAALCDETEASSPKITEQLCTRQSTELYDDSTIIRQV
ncbi:hypothetical protein GX50_06310 [[Emmonsia] crescens]|uniref:Uncharacterized protein n=1 Tax=[Emmonsia] crescens TaxID=73230 RepID=A0A2B7ZBE9_9EURO|nr:hypothetical protein GX50_06310 [Emmonsia crescens]